MNDPPLVSVIIPTYNRSAAVVRAIDSVSAQSVNDLEIIVVDDGSTDDTLDVLGRIPDPRLRVIQHSRNRGGAAARNTGAGAAQGEYLALLDSDDEWDIDKLDTYIFSIERADDDARAAVGAVRRRARDGHEMLLRPSHDAFEPHRLLARPVSGAGSTLVVSRSDWEHIGGCDETLPRHQDWDLVIRLADVVSFVIVEEPLVTVHQGTFPEISTVRAAKGRFLEKHRPRLRALSAEQRRAVLAAHHLDLVALALVLGAWREALTSALDAVRTRPTSFFEVVRQMMAASRRGLRRFLKATSPTQ